MAGGGLMGQMITIRVLQPKGLHIVDERVNQNRQACHLSVFEVGWVRPLTWLLAISNAKTSPTLVSTDPVLQRFYVVNH